MQWNTEFIICQITREINRALQLETRVLKSIELFQPAAIGRGTVGSVSHWHLLSFNLLGFVITCQVHLLSYNSTAQNRSCVIDNQHRFREQELIKNIISYLLKTRSRQGETRRGPLLMFLLRVDKLVFKLPSVGHRTEGGGEEGGTHPTCNQCSVLSALPG